MSWSVSAIGKPRAVAAKVAEDIAKIKCTEPEESIKNQVGATIAAALAAYPDGTAVKVYASGSQSGGHNGEPTRVNSLNVEIAPIYGFIE